MGNQRARKIWGLEKRGAEQLVEHSKKADEERARCKADLKYFYQNILAQNIVDRRTGLTRAQSLGKLHDLMMDFMVFETGFSDCTAYSKLKDFLPKRNLTGTTDTTINSEFTERWLYFKTLAEPPEIQDGPEGNISRMFYESERIWQGIVLKIKGDGLTKCILVPRGHLKSTLCNQTFNLWRIIRDPSLRHLVRSLTSHLARSMVGDIKFQFEQNKRFIRLFGDLGPPTKRELAWNADFIQVRSAERRGRDPTLWAVGMESETTGGHVDVIVMDDIVGETNVKTPMLLADARKKVQHLQSVRDPDTTLIDIGTRWEEDDVHAMFVAADGPAAEDCSFMVATVLDVNNEPIWPEKYHKKGLESIRRTIPEDRIYYGQYFNQFTGTTARTFSPEWILHYEGTPEDVAFHKKLDIFIGIDTATGKAKEQASADYTAIFVLGQTDDRQKYYMLDGLYERLHDEQIPVAIVDIGLKWKDAASGWGGVFLVGVEEIAHVNFLHAALDYEQRKRGVKSIFGIEPLKADHRRKIARIRVMAQPYSDHRVLWPRKLVKASYNKNPYDLIETLHDTFIKYPSVQYDDLLDAHAYAYELTNPRQYAGLPAPEVVFSKDPSIISREKSLSEEKGGGLALGGYEKE